MVVTARKNEGRTTSDPLGIDPLAAIAFVAARERLSEQLGVVSTAPSPRRVPRRRAWRAALARWIRQLAERLETREIHGRRTREAPSSHAIG